MQTIDLAVIMPTLNEQHYVGDLLDSLAKQSVKPQEIIIVDAHSTDKTKEEVEKRKFLFSKLSFYQIPKETISKQRNFGVTKSTASHLLFLDADMTLLDPNTLEKLWKHLQTKKPDVAVCYVMPVSKHLKDKIIYGTGNVIATLLSPFKSIGTTMDMYVKKEVFQTLNGFDENVRVGEDFEFLSRAAKKGFSFRVFHSPVFYTSIRRFHKEGRKKYILGLFKALIHVTRHGHHKNPLTYEFGKFTEKV